MLFSLFVCYALSGYFIALWEKLRHRPRPQGGAPPPGSV
jgi:hypothetical protein